MTTTSFPTLFGCATMLGVRHGVSADVPAFTLRRVILRAAAARSRLLATMGGGVHRSPGAPFGFLVGNTAALVTFLDVLGLTLLLVGVSAFVASWHCSAPCAFA